MTTASFRSVLPVPPPHGTRTYDTYVSPLGTLLLVAEGGALVEIGLDETIWAANLDPLLAHDRTATAGIRRELDEYFAGRRRNFTAPVAPRGTPFQIEVWAALTSIPYGKTATYGEIAAAVRRPKAPRAIGGANHVNPLPIVIPCHRVIGADGSLTGYGGGMERKAFLLDLERRTLGGDGGNEAPRSTAQPARTTAAGRGRGSVDGGVHSPNR